MGESGVPHQQTSTTDLPSEEMHHKHTCVHWLCSWRMHRRERLHPCSLDRLRGLTHTLRRTQNAHKLITHLLRQLQGLNQLAEKWQAAPLAGRCTVPGAVSEQGVTKSLAQMLRQSRQLVENAPVRASPSRSTGAGMRIGRAPLCPTGG
jgi:hypothetical protein